MSSLGVDNYEQNLINELKSRLERDSLLGFTSVGIHRDDIGFKLNDKDMTLTASRGEIRSLLLSLKRFESETKLNLFEYPPLILLDDVFSELDETRQKQLLGIFGESQVIVTTTDTDRIYPEANYLTL